MRASTFLPVLVVLGLACSLGAAEPESDRLPAGKYHGAVQTFQIKDGKEVISSHLNLGGAEVTSDGTLKLAVPTAIKDGGTTLASAELTPVKDKPLTWSASTDDDVTYHAVATNYGGNIHVLRVERREDGKAVLGDRRFLAVEKK